MMITETTARVTRCPSFYTVLHSIFIACPAVPHLGKYPRHFDWLCLPFTHTQVCEGKAFFCIVRRRLACVMPYSSETQVTKSYTFCLFLLNMLETTTKKMKQQYILRNRIFVIFQVCAEGQYDMMQYMCIIISWKFVKLSNGATKRIPICWCIHRCVTQCATNSYMVNDNPVTSIACYNFRLDVKISDYLTAMLANSV